MERIKLFENAINEWHEVRVKAIDKMFPDKFQIAVESALIVIIGICVYILGASVI